MPLFQKKRRFEETVDDVKAELDAIKEEFEGFKKGVEKEMAAIRKDFRELVLFLQESPEPETGEAAEAQEKPEGDSCAENEPTVWAGFGEDLGKLSDQMAALSQDNESLRHEVEALKAAILEETKSIRSSVADAKRDINNKITYAVARLKA